jgi:phosphoribosylglycinamide formyltransferase-1
MTPAAEGGEAGGRVPIGVLISGRGSNLEALLEAARRPGYPARVAVVISNEPAAAGLERAREAGVPALVLDHRQFRGREAHERAIVERLREHGVEWVCLAGYMRVLERELLSAYRGRVLNIHPALLPAFPGTHAQRQALRYGVRVSGATVHLVDEGIDTGPIVLQEAVPVLQEDSEETLAARILAVEHRLYPEAVALAVSGRLRLEGRRVTILPPGGGRRAG